MLVSPSLSPSLLSCTAYDPRLLYKEKDNIYLKKASVRLPPCTRPYGPGAQTQIRAI